MTVVKSASSITMKVVLELNEAEARALYDIVSYGHKPFTDWFYRNLGKHYLKHNEQGLISLFNTVKQEMPKHIAKIDKAREIIK